MGSESQAEAITGAVNFLFNPLMGCPSLGTGGLPARDPTTLLTPSHYTFSEAYG